MGNFDSGYMRHRELAEEANSEVMERMRERETEKVGAQEQALLQARADRARDMVRRGDVELPPELGGSDPQSFDDNPPLMGLSKEDRDLLQASSTQAGAGQAGTSDPKDGQLPSQTPAPVTGAVKGPKEKLEKTEPVDEVPEITSGTSFTALPGKVLKGAMADLGSMGASGVVKSVYHGVRKSAIQTVDLVNDIRQGGKDLSGVMMRAILGEERFAEVEKDREFESLVEELDATEGDSDDESVLQRVATWVAKETQPDKIVKNLLEKLPDVDSPDTVTGSIISGFAEFVPTFMMGMMLAGKTPALARFMTKGGALSRFGRRVAVETGVSALTSAVVLDPNDPKLGDLVAMVVGEDNTPQFMEYLKNGGPDDAGEREADEVMLGRLKNALSDAALGPIFDTVLSGLSGAFRQIRKGGHHIRTLAQKTGLRQDFPFERVHQPSIDLKDVSIEVHRGAKEFGGFTYNMKRGDLAGQDMFSVSAWPEYEVRLPVDSAREIDVTAYINSLTDRGVPLDSEGLSVGLWKDTKKGHMVYDLVQTVKTKEEALELGLRYGQESIFDLKNMEEIKTGFDVAERAGLNMPPIAARISDATSRHIPVENSIAQNVRETAIFAKRVLDDFARSDLGELNLNPKGKLGAQERKWIGNVGAMHLSQGTPDRQAWEKALLTNLDPKIANALTPQHMDEIYVEAGKQYKRFADSAWNARQKEGAKQFPLDGDPIFAGAPGTETGLPALERVMMLFEKGRFRADWYDDAAVELKTMFGEDGELFGKIIAALSPLKNVKQNVSAAFQAYQYFRINGGTFDGFFESSLYSTDKFGMALPNHRNGLVNIEYGGFATGPKVEAFLKNIMGDTDTVTIDSWMTNIFFGKAQTTGPQRQFMQNWVRDIARRADVTPRQAQAALWVGALMEDKSIAKEGVDTLMTIIRKEADRLHKEGKFEVPTAVLPESASIQDIGERYGFAIVMLPFLDPENEETPGVKLQSGFNKLGIEVAGGKNEAIAKILKGLQKFLKEQKLGPKTKKFGDRTKAFASGALVDNPLNVKASTKKSVKEKYEESLRIQSRRTKETGTRTDAQVSDEAKEILGSGEFTVDFIRNLNPGTTFSDAQTQAMIKVWDGEDQKLMKLLEAVEKNPSDDFAVVEFKKQIELMGDLTAAVTGVKAEAGRTLRQFDDVQNASKIRRDSIHQAFGDLTKLAGTDINLVINALKHANARARAQTLTQIGKGGKWTNAFMEVWINSLLSGPQTQIANIGSNAFFQVYEMGERALARKFGQIRQMIRPGSEEAIAPGAVSAQFKGMLESHRASWNLAGELFWKEDLDSAAKGGVVESASIVGDSGLKVEAFRGSRRAISAENLELTGNAGIVADALGYLTRTPTRGLIAGDVYFKGVAFHGQLKTEAWQAGFESAKTAGLNGKAATEHINDFVHKFMADPPESALQKAQDFSEYITFTNDLGDFGSMIQKAANSHPVLKMMMPFTRTPTNILKRAVERSPLGLFLPRNIMSVVSKGGREADAVLARIAMGSSVMMTFGMMAQNGLVTGRAPKDPTLRKTFFNAGLQPYSVKVGDRWVSYSRTEPLGMLIGAAADYSTILSYVGSAEASDIAVGLVAAFATNFTSKTYVRGLAEVIHAVNYPERGGKRFVGNFISTLVPAGSLVRQVGRAMDPEIKDINGVMDRLISNVPALSGTLNPDRGLFGEKRYFSGGVGADMMGPAGWLVNAVSPYFITKATAPHREIYKVLWENEIGIPDRPKKIGNVELSAEQRETLALIIPTIENSNGNTVEQELKEIYASESWASNDIKGLEGLRNAMVQRAIREFYDIGIGMLQESDNSLDEAVITDRITTAVRKSDEPGTDIESEVRSTIGVGQ